MDVRVRASVTLPEGAAAAVVEGRSEATIMVDPDLGLDALLMAVTAALQDYLGDSWLYVGDVMNEPPEEHRATA